MCWRQVTRLQRTVLIIICYSIVYYLISSTLIPEPRYTFVSDDFRVGDKFALIYLSTLTPIFSDLDGYSVFKNCGNCFVTNNKGFVPMSEYDAMLMVKDRSYIEGETFFDPEKSYLMQVNEECMAKKLVGCVEKPTVSPMGTSESFDLCSLCRRLQRNIPRLV